MIRFFLILASLTAAATAHPDPVARVADLRVARADSCFPDTVGRTRQDTTSIGLAPPADSSSDSDDATSLALAQAIRAHFVKPSSVTLPLWARTVTERGMTRYSESDIPGWGLASGLGFRLREGRLVPGSISIHTASPELNMSIAEAIIRADSAGAFAAVGSKRPLDGLMRLRLIDWDQRMGPGAGLLRLIVSAIVVGSPGGTHRHSEASIPIGMMNARINGRVELMYVVDAQGKAVPETVVLVSANASDFVSPAIQAILAGKFKPATLRGCAVPTLVYQRVSFNSNWEDMASPSRD